MYNFFFLTEIRTIASETFKIINKETPHSIPT